MRKWSDLPVDLFSMPKNGYDVTYDSNAKVHHDVFTEVHQHVLMDSAMRNNNTDARVIELLVIQDKNPL